MSKMMMAYIVWLILFERMLQAQAKILKLPASLKLYLWKDVKNGAWKAAQLSGQLTLMTGRHIEVELRISDYQHMAIELRRRIKRIMIQQMKMKMREQQQNADDQMSRNMMTEKSREMRKMNYI